jgi:hypothetical protein
MISLIIINITLSISCNIDFIDEDEICNNPNFHSEEQNESEIPDGKIIYLYLEHLFDLHY